MTPGEALQGRAGAADMAGMAFLQKKTEEEKAADRAAADHRQVAKAAERAAKQAAEAHEKASYRAFVGVLPKWEYKVLTNTALAGWGGGKVSGLEPLLNSVAAEGWRVISMSFTGQIDQFLANDKNHLYVVLERPARENGHSGHPVNEVNA